MRAVLISCLFLTPAITLAQSGASCLVEIQACYGNRCESSLGTGTVIAQQDNQAIILTVGHIFRKQSDLKSYKIRVGVPKVGFCEGQLITVDPQKDLAAILIKSSQKLDVVPIAETMPSSSEKIVAYQYPGGSLKQFRWNGRQANVRSPPHIVYSAPTQSGGSGSGTLYDGKLTSVIWGSTEGKTWATPVGPIRTFLRKRVFPLFQWVFGRHRVKKPQQMVPYQPKSKPPSAESVRPKKPLKGLPSRDGKDGRPGRDAIVDYDKLAGVLQRLRDKLPGAANKLPEAIDKVPEPFKAGFWALIGKAFGVSAFTAGTVATGGGTAAATSLALWAFGALRRRRKRKMGDAGRSAASFRPEPATGAIPRDNREAKEFLRLSKLEGRDPVHDALVGRITYDTLEELIEGKDSPKSSWARDLKNRLEDQFNEMVPLTVTST